MGLALISALISNTTIAEPQIATIVEPFIELRTGPGRGYPIFHVVERGNKVEVIKRRTDWFKVKTLDRKAISGWSHSSQIAKTVDDSETYWALQETDQFDPTNKRWRWSIAGGEFGRINLVATSIAYQLTKNLAAQIQFSQIFGDFSDSQMIVASIQHSPFPHWRISPYLQLGTGLLKTTPFSTIVQTEDTTDQTLNVGIGANYYLSRRFISFIDYRYHTVLTSRNNLEELHEWKIGISVFF
ncbi:MAG: SH3 domain-containing protein [Pseudomonadales bacterium]|nr:SH3 domain-containing protein [Pseudomonadales bacterium]